MGLIPLLMMPIIGAIIGFSTNVLAIAMLFRPHSELRIFGLRLPFTPGLIPRQQRQLAQKMGETIAQNILTGEVLANGLQNSAIVDNIADMVCDAVEKVAASPHAISKILAEALNCDEDELVRAAAENCQDYADKVLAAARDYARHKALPYLQSEDFTRLIMDFAKSWLAAAQSSDKWMADFVPPAALAAAKLAARDNMHRLAPLARTFLADERADTRLRALVRQIAKENAGGLMGLFVNADKIYDSMTQNLLKYLEETENHQLIYDKLAAFADEMLDKQIGDLLGKISPDKLEEWLGSLIAALQSSATSEHVDGIFDAAAQFISADTAIKRLLAIVPAHVLPNMAQHRGAIRKFIRASLAALALKAGEYAVSSLDIAKIAEERINSFETREMERLVLAVVGKHLKWIIMLGGLLGFFMGFAPLILM